MELNGTITAGGALYGAFGTDSGNYNDLRNKPSINGVELVGNKTSEDLHIDPGGTTDYEDLENKPQINYTPLEGNLTLDDLDIQSKIDFPEDPLRFLDGAGQFRSPDYFSGDYDDLANRPEIAGITLTGDKSLTDLGIQEEINFPSDNTKYLDGEGNFTTPAYFSGDYDDLANRPEIAGITLTGNQSLTDLGIQAEIDFPEDNTLYLNGNGNFTAPDYEHLQNIPQINGVNLIGNKSSADLKLISEIHNESGESVIFEADDELPLLSCITDIVATQSGSGTPSPSNPRPINGYTDANITVTDGDTTNVTTISLGRTVYGGTLDVTKGTLTVTYGIVDLGSLNWIKQTDTSDYVVFTQAAPIISRTYTYNFICTEYATAQKTRYELLNGEIGTSNAALTNICIRDDSKEDMTDIQFKTAMEGVMLEYELATPQTYNLTPEEINTLIGENEITSDTGDIEITYVTNVIDPLLKYLLENR